MVLTRVDATHWTITLTGYETTPIEYKYVLGAWDYVEKGASCDELSNRMLTLSYGSDWHPDRERYGAQLEECGSLRELVAWGHP